ncbi:MAG: glycosyltransferase [Ignavibacteria bacterium]|nr:glycosyltransferase [Ignavibacteria bacterium]
MKILQLTPQYPFPDDDGGRIGIANFTREFAKARADVTMFALSAEHPSALHLKQGEQVAKVRICRHSTKNSLLRLAVSAVLPLSIYMWKHQGSEIMKDLSSLLRKEKFDIIHADHSCMMTAALFAQSIQNIPVCLRLHNVEWIIWQRYADSLKPSLKKMYIERQARLLREAEQRLFPKMDAIFAVTEHDKQQALRLEPTANVIVASPGINPKEWMPDSSIIRNPKELVIATTYKWIHNVEGVRWFVENVLPLVRAEIPDVRLSIIGKNPPEYFHEWKDKGVDVIGYVERVQPYLNRAGISIAPLFVGSGVRIKILEAMAMELLVVATPVAMEGIPATESDGLFTSDNPTKTAQIIIDLINNYDHYSQTREAARKFVVENFTWESSAKIMLDTYQQLIEKYHSKS